VLSQTVASVEFNAFYHAERVNLVRFVMFLGADPDTAEDVVQTAFTQAFPVWYTIRFPQAWVRKAAQNVYFMHCRAAARETSLDAALGRADRSTGVSAALALEQQAHTRQFLATGIAGLPPKQRQVMAWTWDGFSDAEIAEQLRDSEATVRKNRSRAMKNLRRLLADEGRGAK
jgi:RNA polymerase sigma factor (sigma-70 family)